LHSRGGRLSADIQAVVAADFIRNLQQETRKGFYGRLKQGLYPMRAPHGYLDCGSGKPKKPDPVVAPLIKILFAKYSTAKYSLHEMTEEMYRLGLRSWSGKTLAAKGISRILNKPFYAGIIHIGKTNETFRGIHQPLISKSQFDRVQLILKGKFHRRIHKHEYLFRRLLKCKHCGYSLIGGRIKGNIYYRCHTKNCPTTSIREDIVEDMALQTINRIQLTEVEAEEFEKMIVKFRQDWVNTRNQKIKAITFQLNQLSNRLDRLTDAFLDRVIEKSLFERRKTNLLLEQKDVEEKLIQLQENGDKIPEKLSDFLHLVKTLCLSYKLGISEEKRDLLKLVTCTRIIDGKNVAFMLNYPFDELAKRQKITCGDPHRRIPATFMSFMKKLIVHLLTCTEKPI